MEKQGLHTNKMAVDFRDTLIQAGLVASGWLPWTRHPNGINKRITLGEVWHRYRLNYLPSISESSRALKIYLCDRFLPPLFSVRMCEINPQVVSEFVRFVKSKRQHPKKCNFDRELKDLKSIFLWYRDEIDFQFANPVKPVHLRLGTLAETHERSGTFLWSSCKHSCSPFLLFTAILPPSSFSVARALEKSQGCKRRISTLKIASSEFRKFSCGFEDGRK